MGNKKEHLLVLGMISLSIALALETLGNNHIILKVIIIILIGISIFSNAKYIVRYSLDSKKKKSK